MKKLKNLKTRIKMAWRALTADNFVFFTLRTHEDIPDEEVIRIALQKISVEYFTDTIPDPYTCLSRLQMIDSVLSDPSVILQSIHDGKPTVIYDCSSEEDLQTLLSQDIENV